MFYGITCWYFRNISCINCTTLLVRCMVRLIWVTHSRFVVTLLARGFYLWCQLVSHHYVSIHGRQMGWTMAQDSHRDNWPDMWFVLSWLVMQPGTELIFAQAGPSWALPVNHSNTDRRLVVTTVVKHWPLTICCWSVHYHRNVVMNTTQSTCWVLSSETIPGTCIVEILREAGFFYLIWCNSLTSTSPQTWTIWSDLSNCLENESNSWDTFTCVGRLICPEGRVSSLNKSNLTNRPLDGHFFIPTTKTTVVSLVRW